MEIDQSKNTGRRSRPWDRISWWYSLILPAPLFLLLLMVSLQPGDPHDALSEIAVGQRADTSVVMTPPIAPVQDSPAQDQLAQGITARAALAVDLTSRVALFDYQADTRVAPASTMKIVTALVVRDVLGLDEEITIEPSDLILGDDYSKMGLQLGDVAMVRALLHGTLLASGGDSALALARAAGMRLDPSTSDPVGRFVDEMNAFAARHGMTGSHFSNPVGIDAGDHYTTAWDMLLATEQLLADPVLAEMVATPEMVVTVGGQDAREVYLVSTNQLVLNGESSGVKTGSTDGAGECLVNVTWNGDHQMVTVIMGSVDRYADTRVLLDFVG